MFKQRVVGGLVLLAIGAIVLPFLLDMHRDDQWWGKANIPPKPADGFVTRVLPLDSWAQQTQSDLAQTNPAPSPPVPDKVPSPAGVPTPPAAPPVATPVSAAVPGPQGWLVQLASFSSAANAEELRQRLQAKGYRVTVVALKQEGQPIYRVRVGPEAQRAAAEGLRERVARDFKLNGLLMRLP